jgi:hypothetical protein
MENSNLKPTVTIGQVNTEWKKSRLAVWGVCIIQFIIMIILQSSYRGNPATSAAPILINFLITKWYIKNLIAKSLTKEQPIKNPIMLGIKVPFVIFLIQLALGTLLYYLFIVK